jgi:hypothetical protein
MKTCARRQRRRNESYEYNSLGEGKGYTRAYISNI